MIVFQLKIFVLGIAIAVATKQITALDFSNDYGGAFPASSVLGYNTQAPYQSMNTNPFLNGEQKPMARNQMWRTSPYGFQNRLQRVRNEQNLNLNSQATTFTLKRGKYDVARRDSSVPGVHEETPIEGTISIPTAKQTDKEMRRKEIEEIQELKRRVTETTKQIQSMYKSINLPEETQRNNRTSESSPQKQSRLYLIKKLKKSYETIKYLKNRLAIESEVRKEMIRYLAKAKLSETMKTRALHTVLEYFHPDKTLFQSKGIPESLRRVIIKERINMLPKTKRLELQQRISSLKSSPIVKN